jgi:CRP/FNR family transcriptional regulator, anaerobic regulatory protein
MSGTIFNNKKRKSRLETAKNELLGIFQSLCTLSPGLQQRLKEDFEIRVYPRKVFLVIPGEINPYLYVVVKGTARSFFINEAEKEITTRLMAESSFINLNLDSPSLAAPVVFTELLEQSTIAQIHKDKLEYLVRDFPEFGQVNLVLSRMIMQELSDYAEIKHFVTPLARLRCFSKKFPLLVNRIPAKYIAGFLGISPETLSRTKELFFRHK